MGYWTYCYADINKKRSTVESMDYDGRKPVVLALPDGTFLTENHYFGYGDICGYDVLELVVDWNRHTTEAVAIIEKHLAECYEEQRIKTEKNDPDDEFRLRVLKGEIAQFEAMHNWLNSPDGTPLPEGIEKREVGIAIATYSWELEMLRYPIKFVKNTKYPYDRIKGYSDTTQ